MRRRWLAIAVILTVPSGCDNVKWGGMDVHLQAPSARQAPHGAERARPDSLGTAPAGTRAPAPLFLAGTRTGDSVTLAVVGEAEGDSLAPYAPRDTTAGSRRSYASVLPRPGSALVLFSQGVRVGHLIVSRTGVDSSYCTPRPTVTGVVEVVPPAAGAERFLALSPGAAGRPYGTYEALEDDYQQRVASLRLAVQAIQQVGAKWPPSVLATRADIEVFRLHGEREPFVAATFLYRDQLSTAAPAPGAYDLFVMGSQQDTTYRSDFVWYRTAAANGKGAPRYFGHLDLNGDGQDEVLLDVFGSGTHWFALLGKRSGGWVRVFEDPCGRSGSSPSS